MYAMAMIEKAFVIPVQLWQNNDNWPAKMEKNYNKHE